MKTLLKLTVLLLFAMPLAGGFTSCYKTTSAEGHDIGLYEADGQAIGRGVLYTSLSASSGVCSWDAFGSNGDYQVQLYNRTDTVLEQQLSTLNTYCLFNGMSVRDCFDITVTRNGQLLRYYGAYNP